ncbi:MAG TPA: hypothetical protein QGG30_01825 [Acidobacteriota bacterium]|nr:hypothetical protein [Acidobacteriota bacterium]HJO29208.1 hypothetical protein [Acidobacteriota bacterium]
MNRNPALLSCLYLMLAATLLFPQTTTGVSHQDNLSGAWSGTMVIAGDSIDLRVVLQATTGGGWTGLIDIPAQNTSGFPLTEISVAGNVVSFAMVGVPGDPVFVGTWNERDQTIVGNLEQSGQTFPFSLALSNLAVVPEITVVQVSPANAVKIVGTWGGLMSAGTQTLQIVFHLEATAGGVLQAIMDSPDQGQFGLPVNKASFDGSILRLELDYADASFEGTMAADGLSIEGTWSQGGASLPLLVDKQ